MKALLLTALLALSGCASAAAPMLAGPPELQTRPVTAADRIDGRWTIKAVNGQEVGGLWLELANTQATYQLGCNSGGGDLSRNGDKLFIDKALLTQRGCDAARLAVEEQAIKVIRAAMTMEFTEPDRLRLVNEWGTIDLVRSGVS